MIYQPQGGLLMAYSKPGYQRTGRMQAQGKASGKYIQPRVKLSMLGKAYNKIRWLCYFLPVLGFIIIGYGIYFALWQPMKYIIVSQTVIAGGAVMTYLAIYYNKRT